MGGGIGTDSDIILINVSYFVNNKLNNKIIPFGLALSTCDL